MDQRPANVTGSPCLLWPACVLAPGIEPTIFVHSDNPGKHQRSAICGRTPLGQSAQGRLGAGECYTAHCVTSDCCLVVARGEGGSSRRRLPRQAPLRDHKWACRPSNDGDDRKSPLHFGRNTRICPIPDAVHRQERVAAAGLPASAGMVCYWHDRHARYAASTHERGRVPEVEHGQCPWPP